MTNDEIVNRWLVAFASTVPKGIMKEHIVQSCNHLWHIFTWGAVPCVEGDNAWKVFNDLSFDKVIVFRSGYSVNHKPQIEEMQVHDKISATALVPDITTEDKYVYEDIYFVDVNFQWTYVHTHEWGLGPYFCYRTE